MGTIIALVVVGFLSVLPLWIVQGLRLLWLNYTERKQIALLELKSKLQFRHEEDTGATGGPPKGARPTGPPIMHRRRQPPEKEIHDVRRD